MNERVDWWLGGLRSRLKSPWLWLTWIAGLGSLLLVESVWGAPWGGLAALLVGLVAFLVGWLVTPAEFRKPTAREEFETWVDRQN